MSIGHSNKTPPAIPTSQAKKHINVVVVFANYQVPHIKAHVSPTYLFILFRFGPQSYAIINGVEKKPLSTR